MQSLKIWHPDILEFIECKWKEEKKAHCLIEKGGYEANFNGEAYSSILFQNANLSVRVTDEFMQAVEKNQQVDDALGHRSEQAKARRTTPSWLLDRMAECAWHCGDPGVQYDTTINRWHTCPNSGRINASNPCSEYMFLDNTACNLASINLMKFRQPDGTFDVERFKAACRIFFIAQEILVDHASYPTADIARNSHLFRPLGLGYSNLGSLLMSEGMPYDSRRGLRHVRRDHGPAARHGQPDQRRNGGGRRPVRGLPQESRADAPRDADASRRGREDQRRRPGVSEGRRPQAVGRSAGARHAGTAIRNAQATVLAPTGTISFMMDCDTTGIEPDIALVKYKQLAGGGMLKIVNNTVPLALKTLGYDDPQIKAHRASTSTSTTRSKGPRTSPTSTCRSSTVPSSRPTASAASTGGPTSA